MNKMKGVYFLLSLLVLGLESSFASASDPSPLHDFHVAVKRLKLNLLFNRGYTNAVTFAGLISQNAEVITITNSVFGSDPRINPDALTKAFQVDKNIIDYLQKKFWVDNNN
ncbi:hypothetical protein FEM48_Zijuj02G0178300 [Ziziphus jujuba var. spinosa]|uniref:Cupin type-1 domain-containing protein n=1 Tax=Ziziphus jujuba var. spinosa TaxID=714518 RepID=A0A978VX38_ZIZJJ|nr:hypothetical protein FEM48_Zijuj02G0178300 [Ziziphus jujuba var. spinosa]